MDSPSVQEEQELAYEDNTPTPAGWRRKLIPHIGKSLVPARIDVVFVAPSGEEFKSKAQLQRYLKANKESPPLSEFIWITDETPQRSLRSASKCSLPSKTISKKKPATEAPLREKKTTKRSHPEEEEAVEEELTEDQKRHNRKASKVDPGESKEDHNGEISLIEGEKDINGALTKATKEVKKTMKDAKKKRNMKAERISNKASSKVTETTPDMQRSDGQCENREEEKLEMNGKEETVEENGNKERVEQPFSPEEKDTETLEMETEMKEHNKAKYSNEGMENGGLKDMENDDGTTTSLLASDLSAEGVEADSDIFESDEGHASHEDVDTAQQEHADVLEGS